MTTKEKEQPKFKVGDKIIHNVLCNGTPLKECNFKIVEHIDLSNGSYEIYDKELNNFEFLKIKTADKDYINIDDCLFYWEYVNINGDWTHGEKRCNKREFEKMFATYNYNSSIPIYQLGARLKKEI